MTTAEQQPGLATYPGCTVLRPHKKCQPLLEVSPYPSEDDVTTTAINYRLLIANMQSGQPTPKAPYEHLCTLYRQCNNLYNLLNGFQLVAKFGLSWFAMIRHRRFQNEHSCNSEALLLCLAHKSVVQQEYEV